MSRTLPILLALAAILPAAAQPGSSTIKDPRGFTFQVPAGFKPSAMGTKQGLRGASVQAPDGSAALMVFNETQNQPPEACLQQVLKMAGPQNPTLVSDKLVSQQPYVVMREYTYPTNSGPGRVRVMFMDQGNLYRAYFVMGQQQNFAADEKALDGVCNSFQLTAPSP